jgi:hypothetical protein
MEGIVDHKTNGHAVQPSDMYITHGISKPRVGTCVLNGKMGLQAGSAWWMSRKATQLKLLSMPLQRACLAPLLLYGGPQIPSRSAVELLML